MKVRLWVRSNEFQDACILKVLAGTEAPTLSAHSVTLVEFESNGCWMIVEAEGDKRFREREVRKLRLVLYGDAEVRNIIKAFRFIADALENQYVANEKAREGALEVEIEVD
jgi:hypothetical protein